MFQSCISINIRIHIHIILVIFYVRSRACAHAIVGAVFGPIYAGLLATRAMKELQQGDEPFFPAPVVHNEYCKEYWAMSHTRSRLLNHIATKLVPYVCDHEFETWTADRHYNDAKCRRGTCLCCFARTKHGYEPHNQYVCQYVDMRDIVLAYGVARPRWWYVFTAAERQAKKAWGKGRGKGYKPHKKKNWNQSYGTWPVADECDQPQDGGQPEIEADDTSGAAPPVADEKKELQLSPTGYEPQTHPTRMSVSKQNIELPLSSLTPSYLRADLEKYNSDSDNIFWKFERELLPWWPLWDNGKAKTNLYRLIDDEKGLDLVFPGVNGAISHKLRAGTMVDFTDIDVKRQALKHVDKFSEPKFHQDRRHHNHGEFRHRPFVSMSWDMENMISFGGGAKTSEDKAVGTDDP